MAVKRGKETPRLAIPLARFFYFLNNALTQGYQRAQKLGFYHKSHIVLGTNSFIGMSIVVVPNETLSLAGIYLV